MAVKFLHTADWQIGKAFAKLPDDASVPLREQRIETIKKIAALAAAESVDAVLVAGDVFEYETIAERTLHKTLHAMSAYKGPWLMLPGNHDPATTEGVWAQLRRLDPPDNVIILDKPQCYELPKANAVVLAAPLQRKHEATDITEWFDHHETPAGTIRIGLAHGSMDNRLPDRGEAPNTISDRRVKTANLDYLALGDWHGTLQIDARAWYSGTHETDRFRDNDSGNVLLVTIESPQSPPAVAKHRVGHYRWHQLSPQPMDDMPADALARALEQLGEPVENLVLQVAPCGVASLSDRALISKVVTRWSALVRYLEYDDSGLVSEVTVADMDDLAAAGFVTESINELQTIAGDTEHAQRRAADLALQILFSEYKQMVHSS